jgi:YbbR domain-containing protein
MIRILTHNWPQKLGALLLATLLWAFISLNDPSVTQRSLLVPITIEGVEGSRVAIGIPEMVEVTVSGPSNRVNRLRPDRFVATLDLSGIIGGFQEEIDVQAPSDISLLRTSPRNVIGSVDALSAEAVPIDVLVLAEPPVDLTFEITYGPETTLARGRSGQLEQVDRAVGFVLDDRDDTVSLYAVDEEGMPVSGVSLEPNSVTIELTRKAVFEARQLRLVVSPPRDIMGTVTTRSEPSLITVYGPASILNPLSEIRGSVEFATGEIAPGRYTLPVSLELPEGVAAQETPIAFLQITPLGLQQ